MLEADRKAKSFANLARRSRLQEKLLFMFVLGKHSVLRTVLRSIEQEHVRTLSGGADSLFVAQ